MVSMHPLTRLIHTIENPHIKDALLSRLGGPNPNTLSATEVKGLFKAGAENDRTVKGHDMTESEVRDYVRIHAYGNYLFKSGAASKLYDAELRKYTGLPTVELTETDPGLNFRSGIAKNKVELSGVANGDLCPGGVVCIIGGPTAASIKVDGNAYSVQPQANEPHQSVAKRLAAELEADGYKVKVHTTRTKSSIEVKAQKPLSLKSLTTDNAVRMGIQGNQITVDVGIGASTDLAGGRIGVSVNGKPYTEDTVAGQPASVALTLLRRQLEVAGFEIKVASLPTIDTINELWSLKPVSRPMLANGAYTEVSGTVQIEGDQRFLALDKAIRIDNAVIDRVELFAGPELAAGPARLSGQVNLRELEVHPVQYQVTLSGISNLAAGEPRYDGNDFFNAAGDKLAKLSYDVPNMYDGPSRVFALDGNLAHIGSGGGMRRNQDVSWFHGFSATAPITDPSRGDYQAIRTAADGTATNAAGAELTRIGKVTTQGGGPNPVPLTTIWFYDAQAQAAYGVQYGNLARPNGVLTQVIHEGA